MRIVVVGTGYVGMASAALLAQRHDVCAVDIDQSRVEAISDRRSPSANPDIEDFLTTKVSEQSIDSRPLWKPMHLQPAFASAEAGWVGTLERLPVGLSNA